MDDGNGIRVQPDDLERVAGELRTHASNIQAAIDQVEAEMQRMSVDQFSGQRADQLRARYNSMRQTLEEFCPMLTQFSELLDTSAVRFRTADRNQGNLA